MSHPEGFDRKDKSNPRIFFGHYDLESCMEARLSKNNISGRKFAENTGLEDAKRINNDPL